MSLRVEKIQLNIIYFPTSKKRYFCKASKCHRDLNDQIIYVYVNGSKLRIVLSHVRISRLGIKVNQFGSETVGYQQLMLSLYFCS